MIVVLLIAMLSSEAVHAEGYPTVELRLACESLKSLYERNVDLMHRSQVGMDYARQQMDAKPYDAARQDQARQSRDLSERLSDEAIKRLHMIPRIKADIGCPLEGRGGRRVRERRLSGI